MSNIIPPLLSNSPPPMVAALDDEEDEFGDFTSAGDASYNYDSYSLPSTPQHGGDLDRKSIDINSNTSKLDISTPELFIVTTNKDFQHKKNNCDLESISATDVNSINNQFTVNNVHTDKNIYCNETITHQHSQIESVPIDEMPTISPLSHEGTLVAWEDTYADKINDISICNKANDAVQTFIVETNVPSTTNEMPSTNVITSENLNLCQEKDSENYEEISEESLKSHKDILNEQDPCQTIVNTKSEEEIDCINDTDINNYYYDEPPDLHIIDDKTVNIDDFAYYKDYESDFENESIYSKLENERDVNENKVNTSKQNNAPVNELLESVDNRIELRNVLLPAELCEDCSGDDISIEPKKETILNIEHDKFHNAKTSDNSYDDSEIKNADICEIDSKSAELVNTDKDDGVVHESTSIYTDAENLNVQSDDGDDKIVSLSKPPNSSSPIPSDKLVDDVEFGDFTQPEATSKIAHVITEATPKASEYSVISTTTPNEDSTTINNNSSFEATNSVCYTDETDFGDFADFSHSFPETNTDVQKIELPDNQASDKISDLSEQLKGCDLEDEDDFYDFGEFSQASTSTHFASPVSSNVCTSINKKNVLEYSEKILLEVFPLCTADTADTGDYVAIEYLNKSLLFNQIKDITETNALSYQWAKSTSQEKLLNALNIDTRNILYGPGWNPMMPKFAANLRKIPLEPVKSEVLTPTPALTSNSSSILPESTQGDVPSAQFDWKGAGLVNPLDSAQNTTILLDLEQLVVSLDLSHTSVKQSPNDDEPDEWEYWLKSLPPDPKDKPYDLDMKTEHVENSLDFSSHRRSHSDNESVKSLQLTTEVDKSDFSGVAATEEFDEFTGFQSSSTVWQKSLPLKETYISSELTDSGKVDPFKLLTSNSMTSEDVQKSTISVSEDDEFTDFQMSLPINKIDGHNSKDGSSGIGLINHVADIMQPIPTAEPLKPSIVPKTTSTPPEILWPDPGIISEELLHLELTYSRKQNCDTIIDMQYSEQQPLENNKSHKDELSVQRKISTLPNFENAMTNKVVSGNSVNDFQYKANADKDKRNNNVSFSKSQQLETFFLCSNSGHSVIDDKAKITKHKHQTNKTSTNIFPFSLVGKENIHVNDRHRTERVLNTEGDDEWSDFVCNPEPLKYSSKPGPNFNIPERTNTPELQLSIPHLSQLQPPKQPIPVITPQGLIQTKIPSNTSNLNVYQPSPYTSTLRNVCQPSIISQQYQNHLNGPVFPKLPENTAKPQESMQTKLNLQTYTTSKKNNSNDDDDWTEFVSSAPAQQTKAQHQKFQKQNCNGWSGSVIPNIITNPTHFDLCSYMSQKPQNSSTHLNFSKTIVPSISALPELDFAAPTSKAFKKK